MLTGGTKLNPNPRRSSPPRHGLRKNPKLNARPASLQKRLKKNELPKPNAPKPSPGPNRANRLPEKCATRLLRERRCAFVERRRKEPPGAAGPKPKARVRFPRCRPRRSGALNTSCRPCDYGSSCHLYHGRYRLYRTAIGPLIG